MSLISSRREQAGGYGEERSDSVTCLAGNNVFTCPVHTAFHQGERGAANEDTARKKTSTAGCPTIKDHNASLGGLPVPPYLFQDCHLNFESVEEGLESVELEAVSVCQEFWRRKLTQSCCLSK